MISRVLIAVHRDSLQVNYIIATVRETTAPRFRWWPFGRRARTLDYLGCEGAWQDLDSGLPCNSLMSEWLNDAVGAFIRRTRGASLRPSRGSR